MPTRTIEARYRTVCPFSKRIIMPGDRVAKFDATEMANRIRLLCDTAALVPDVAELIADKAYGHLFGKWGHADAVETFVVKTASGRVVRAPLRQAERKHLPGSINGALAKAGVSQCDHYDFDYDINDCRAHTDDGPEPEETQEDRDFIDDGEVEVEGVATDDEEEDSEWEDEEDDDDEDWEADDSEDDE